MTSSKASRKSLTKLAQQLSIISAAAEPGESYHEKYKKDRESFRKLINQEMKLEKTIRRFQKDLKNHIPDLIDWQAYALGQAKMSGPEKWRELRQDLERRILTDLEPAFALGKKYGEAQFRVPSDISVDDPKVQGAFRKRVANTANSVVKTFKKRLFAKLKTVLRKRTLEAEEFPGEPFNDYPFGFTDEFKTDLETVADDPSKANEIGRTEVIAAVAISLLLYAEVAGGKMKTWRTVGGAEEICRELEGKKVPIGEPFDSLVGPVDMPPDPHPRCRCYLDLSTS